VDPGKPFHEDAGDQAGGPSRGSLDPTAARFQREAGAGAPVVDLNQIVAGITRMLDRTIGEDIELVTDLAPELGRVHADAIQLEQVLLNLAVNAGTRCPKEAGSPSRR
jgi:C4-dicarboxylate-specific signal transduction histidine kinase